MNPKKRGRLLKWDTIIEQKTNELSRFLTGKLRSLDFVEPVPRLERQDSRELRAKILALTASRAERLGIGKSTLHYLRNNVRNERSFKFYRRVAQRLRATAQQAEPSSL